MEVCTVKEYIQSKISLTAKILAIEALIDKMLLDTINSEGAPPDWISNSGVASYSMDDGQMKVSTQYRSIDQVINGIKSLEKLLQIYINRNNGHTTVLRGRLNY